MIIFKKLISVLLVFTILICVPGSALALTSYNSPAPVASVLSAEHDGDIISPSSAELDTIDITKGKIKFEAVANGKSKISFCFDGVVFKSFDAIDDSMYTYTAYCDLSDENIGIHEFSVIRTIGTTDVVVNKIALNLVGRYKGILQSEDGDGADDHKIADGIYPYDTETFEADFLIAGMWKMCRYSDHIHSQGATNDNTIFDIKSDETSDGKYLYLESKKAVIPATRYISLASKGTGDATVSMVPVQLGVWELEFDIRLNSDCAGIGFRGFPLWGSYNNSGGYYNGGEIDSTPNSNWNEQLTFLTPEGKVRGTDVAWTADTWMHFKLNYDNRAETTAANGGKGLWNVYKDGVKIVDNQKDCGLYSGDNRRQVNMYFFDRTAEKLAKVCLDNLALSLQKTASGINSLSYNTAESQDISVLSNDIPETAKSINIELDNVPANFSASDVTVSKGGEALACNVSMLNNVITVSDFGKLSADDKILVNIKLGDDALGKSSKGQKSIAAYINVIHNLITSVKARQNVSELKVTAEFNPANVNGANPPLLVAYIYGPDNEIISLDTLKLKSPYTSAELKLNLASYDADKSKVRFYALEGDYMNITYQKELVW